MPRVTITCPDRRGEFPGWMSHVGFFKAGETVEVDISDADLATLQRQVERKETILSFEIVKPPQGKK